LLACLFDHGAETAGHGVHLLAELAELATRQAAGAG
jgi:hypothetical protein